MNLFIVDSDPRKAARALCDKHVVKMVLETCQLLCTAHRVCNNRPVARIIYRVTHLMHPCSRWVRATAGNYLWAYVHFEELLREYQFRYGRVHKCHDLLAVLANVPDQIPAVKRTGFCVCVPETFRQTTDPVNAYRTYYANEKHRIARWTRRAPPSWWPGSREAALQG